MGFFSKILGAAAPIVGGMIGGPAGAAIGSAAAGALGTQDAQNFATNSASTANAFTREQLQNRHQWEAADLRKAGRNPILYAGSTPSIGGAAQANTSANLAQDTAAQISSAAQSSQQKLNLEKLSSEIDLLNANTNAANSASAKSLAEAANIGNKANVSQLGGNLAKGLHGLTENTGKGIADIISKTWENIKHGNKRASLPKSQYKGLKLGPNANNPGFKLPY